MEIYENSVEIAVLTKIWLKNQWKYTKIRLNISVNEILNSALSQKADIFLQKMSRQFYTSNGILYLRSNGRPIWIG